MSKGLILREKTGYVSVEQNVIHRRAHASTFLQGGCGCGAVEDIGAAAHMTRQHGMQCAALWRSPNRCTKQQLRRAIAELLKLDQPMARGDPAGVGQGGGDVPGQPDVIL